MSGVLSESDAASALEVASTTQHRQFNKIVPNKMDPKTSYKIGGFNSTYRFIILYFYSHEKKQGHLKGPFIYN